jgi:nitrite reductase/ring-hydroxylating ferredoxin subunit
MPKWVNICEVNELPVGGSKCARVEGVPLALYNVEGKIHAIADVCPHAGMPLAEGELCGKIIVCPFHGYSYNIETGKNTDFPDQEDPVKVFPVRVENQVVQVDIQMNKA